MHMRLQMRTPLSCACFCCSRHLARPLSDAPFVQVLPTLGVLGHRGIDGDRRFVDAGGIAVLAFVHVSRARDFWVAKVPNPSLTLVSGAAADVASSATCGS